MAHKFQVDKEVSDFWTPLYTATQINRANQRLFVGVPISLFMFPLVALPECKGHLASWNETGAKQKCVQSHIQPLLAPLTQTVLHVCCRVIFQQSCEVLPELHWNRFRHKSQRHWEAMGVTVFQLRVMLSTSILQLYTPTIAFLFVQCNLGEKSKTKFKNQEKNRVNLQLLT